MSRLRKAHKVFLSLGTAAVLGLGSVAGAQSASAAPSCPIVAEAFKELADMASALDDVRETRRNLPPGRGGPAAIQLASADLQLSREIRDMQTALMIYQRNIDLADSCLRLTASVAGMMK
jgi:hypothetical protein